MALMTNIDDEVQEQAQIAVDMASKQGKVLDYSEKSIAMVEEILGEIYSDIKSGKLAETEAPQLANVFGSYVGETLRKVIGRGNWIIPDDGPGAGAWTLQIDGGQTFFPAKAYRRITAGPEDNIKTLFDWKLSGLRK
jgi:hypothetical protein